MTTKKTDSHPKPRRMPKIVPEKPVEVIAEQEPVKLPVLEAVGPVITLGMLLPDDLFAVGSKFYRMGQIQPYGIDTVEVRVSPDGLESFGQLTMGYTTQGQRANLS
jgi:hypothetical protein